MKRIFAVSLSALFALCAFAEELKDLKAVLDSQKGAEKITVPKGKYFIDKFYVFENLENVSVDMGGSEIVCRKRASAFRIKNCKNFKLSNFSLDYQPLCFTQGEIVEVGDGSFVVRIFKGYQMPLTGENTKQGLRLFDPETRALKQNYITYHSVGKITAEEKEAHFRIYKPKYMRSTDAERVGELAVIKLRGGGHAIQSENCENLFFEDITIYGAPSFSMYEGNCSNSVYERCTLKRKEDDASVEYPRLVAGNADGIHSYSAPVGPKIRNCTVRDVGDDAITITSRYYPVYKVDENEGCVYVLSRGEPVFKDGDSLMFLKNGGAMMGRAACLSFEKVQVEDGDFARLAKGYKFGFIHGEKLYKHATKVKISPWIEGLAVGDIFNALDRSGRGFAIENNFSGFTRARAIFVKASEGVIKNNRVEGSELGGIVLSQELNWMSGGNFYGVEISGNSVKNCLFGASDGGGYQAGAISVVSTDGNREFSPMGAMKDITVKDNTLEECAKPAIVISSVDGLVFENNKIISSPKTHTRGEKLGVKNDEDVFMINTRLKK